MSLTVMNKQEMLRAEKIKDKNRKLTELRNTPLRIKFGGRIFAFRNTRELSRIIESFPVTLDSYAKEEFWRQGERLIKERETGKRKPQVKDKNMSIFRGDDFNSGLEQMMRQQYERVMKSSDGMMYITVNDGRVSREPETTVAASKRQLEEAAQAIKEMTETLERISKEPLLMHTVNKISKDGKYTFVKKGDQELRIEASSNLKVGHEVTLHPKSLQIVEDLGFPPLEASEFCPTTIPNVHWDDIGGLELAKADMIEAIELPHKEKDLYKYYGKRPVKGILLEGPPGCGKTMLGKAAARSLADIYGAENSKTGFLYIKGPEILNQYVGASEETIREIFISARRHFEEKGYPAIIFIDEAESILSVRGGRGFNLSATIVPSFLTEMDGLEDSSAIVILATNRPDILDPAIIREGRIDRKVKVTRPDQVNGMNIILMNLKKYPISKKYDIHNLAEGMAHEVYSDERVMGHDDKYLRDIVNGAMLAACVDLAVASAMKRDIATGKKSGICPEDIIYAVDRIHSQNIGLSHDFNQTEEA